MNISLSSFTHTNTYATFNKIVALALKQYDKKNYEKCLHLIAGAAKWMYGFNLIYTDSVLENLIHNIAINSIKKTPITSPLKDNIVFIDNFGQDNRCLTQQYLRGLMNLKKNILYILVNSNPNNNSEILRELNSYPKAKVVIHTTERNKIIPGAETIAKEIVSFAPHKIFVHIYPWDLISLLAIDSISGATIYNINLTDHAFWLGSSFFDFNIEFRSFGETLSLEKRNFNKSQLIRLPYYPIVSKYTKFQGFPDLPENAIKVFCGGAEYKMLGKNGIFFKLMDEILAISPDVYILVAGIKPDLVFASNVRQMRNKDRVILIGDRKDIYEVYRHSDIYLSSYPLLGALMVQYAVLASLPILAYIDEDDYSFCEGMVSHYGNVSISKKGIDEFREYAKKLISSNEYRRSEGAFLRKNMIDESRFNQELNNVINTNKTTITFLEEYPDYDKIANHYLDVQKKGKVALKMQLKHFKISAFANTPQYAFNYLLLLGNYICKYGKSVLIHLFSFSKAKR